MTRSARGRDLGAFMLLLALALVAYFPAVHGGLLWDDDAHVTRPDLRSLHGLARIWLDVGATQQYYPLLHTAFWVEHRLWGDAPTGYHLVSLLLHACAAALAWRALRRLEIPGAYLAAVLFVVHPVQVESVAWITELKNTLSAVFYLAAACAYLRFDENRRPRWYGLALALFVLGLLSKTVTATLPAALLVLFWWKRARLSWKKDVVPLLPWLGLGAIAGLFTAWVERTLIGADGAAFALSLPERCLLAGRALWFYAGKLVWPARLTFIYPRWDVHGWSGWAYAYLAGAFVLAALAWRMRGRNRGPLAALLFFAGTLFPVLGFFNVYPFLFSFVADHFVYLASLGIFTPAAALISIGVARLPGRTRGARHAAVIALVALVALLAAMTRRQNGMYADVRTLYRATLARNPRCWMALNNLGEIRAAEGATEEAAALYEQALHLRPDYPEAHNNLGTLRMAQGRIPEAAAHFDEALRIRPDFVDALSNSGLAAARAGNWGKAIESYERAIAIEPDHLEAHDNLGIALLVTGRAPNAIPQFELVLRARPERADTRFNLAGALLVTDRPEEAIAQLEQTLRLRPGYPEAHYNLGVALARVGKRSQAIDHFEEALRLRPDYPNARKSLDDLRGAAAR